jgi:hypothetical protein
VWNALWKEGLQELETAAKQSEKKEDKELLNELRANDLSLGSVQRVAEHIYRKLGINDPVGRVKLDFTEPRSLSEIFKYANELIVGIQSDTPPVYKDGREKYLAYRDIVAKNPTLKDHIDTGIPLDKHPTLPWSIEQSIISQLVKKKVPHFSKMIDTRAGFAQRQERGVKRVENFIALATPEREARVAKAEKEIASLGLDKKVGKDLGASAVRNDDGRLEDRPDVAKWLDGKRQKVRKELFARQNGGMTPDGLDLDPAVLNYRLALAYGKKMAHAKAEEHDKEAEGADFVGELEPGDVLEVPGMPGWSVANVDGHIEVYAEVAARIDYKQPVHPVTPNNVDPNPPARVLAQHLIDANTGEYLMNHGFMELTTALKDNIENAINKQEVILTEGERPAGRDASGQPKTDVAKTPMYHYVGTCRVYPYDSGKKVGLRPMIGDPLPYTVTSRVSPKPSDYVTVLDGRPAYLVTKDGRRQKNPAFVWKDPQTGKPLPGDEKDERSELVAGPERLGEIVEPVAFVPRGLWTRGF